MQAHGCGDCLRHEGGTIQGGLAEGGQLHQPDAILIPLRQVRRYLEGQPGLATAPRADERHQRHPCEQIADCRLLPLPPDEAGRLQRQVGSWYL